MAGYELTKIRNIGIIAHIDAGKTTTTEHLLFYTGAKHKLGAVDAGTTETDYDLEEQERGITIYSACVPFQWRDCTVNLIDTPGHVDFTAEVERALRVLDGCIVVFDAQKGVEAQSETVWRQANKYAVPRLVFINKMDVVGANFANALEEVRERLDSRPVALNIPIGSGSPKDSTTPFTAIIDLVEMAAVYFEGELGEKVRRDAIPDHLRQVALNYREKLFDALSQYDEQDRLTTAYLEGRDIAADTIREMIRDLTLRQLIQPVLCGSGREHIGIQPLLDAVCLYLPAPVDRPPVVGSHPKKPGREEKRKPSRDEPLCALVFKIVADPHGELFYVRIYSGILKANSRPYNAARDKKEFITKLYHVHADPSEREELTEASAGDIVAVIGMKESITGDTLCDYQHPILLEAIQFARGVVSRSIEPESSADKEKLVATLNLLKREDPTFDWKVDAETGQTVMTGMGVLHLEVKEHRMERDFRLRVRVGKPRVSYRETVKSEVRSEAVFERHIAGTFVSARAALRLKPGAGEAGELVTCSFDEREFPPGAIQALKKAISGALESGWFGYPVIDLHVEATGLFATVDAPANLVETAIGAAAADAVQKGLRDNVSLLEPVMRLEVTVPEEYLGAITADLNVRRAEIEQLFTRGKLRVIEVLVPLARMFDYSDKVRSLSQGRASWTMEPHSYAPAPPEVLDEFFGAR